MNTRGINNNMINNSSNNSYVNMYANNNANPPQVQHIAPPMLPQSNNNGSYNINYRGVHNIQRYCNNSRYAPM